MVEGIIGGPGAALICFYISYTGNDVIHKHCTVITCSGFATYVQTTYWMTTKSNRKEPKVGAGRRSSPKLYNPEGELRYVDGKWLK